MEDRLPSGLKSPPLGDAELEALESIDADGLLDDLHMGWDAGEEEPSGTFATGSGARRRDDDDAKRSRYKPRVGAARERNIEVQRRYRQRIKERGRKTEDAVAAAAAELAALRAENSALHAHHDALTSLADYSHAALSALRTFSATLATAAGSYFHAAQLRLAMLHADTIEAMFNAVRRPTDAQLRALAADVDFHSPLLGRVNMSFMVQLTSFLHQWSTSGAHGRVVVERKLKILFDARDRFIKVLIENHPDKAAFIMERLRLQGQEVVRAVAARGSVAAAADEVAHRSPLAAVFGNGFMVASAGKETVEAMTAQRDAAVSHPDLLAAVQLSDAQKASLREAWAGFVHVYNSRIRGRVETAVAELGDADALGDAVPGLAAVGTAQAAGRRALSELEAFGREELYARVALARRAFSTLTPIQTAYSMLMQMPNPDVVMMYRRILAVRLEDVPPAARPHLRVYFEEEL